MRSGASPMTGSRARLMSRSIRQSSSNGKTYSRLHLEEPTTKMVLRAEGELSGGTANMAQLRAYQIALVSNSAGVPRAVIESMRISQMLECYNFLLPFFGAGQPTGEN